MSAKQWIAAFIGIISAIGLILGITNNAFGNPIGTVNIFGAAFNAAQVFWLGVLWGLAALWLWLFVPERAPEPTVDLTPVNRLETQVRGFEGRFGDLNSRLDARLGDVDMRLKSLEAAPRALGFSRPGEPDDLKIIEGIGPKMEQALKAAGIDTFAKLAQTSEAAIRSAIERAGLSFAPSVPTWARQAKYIVDGDLEGFEAYKARLTAGRE
jgi:hypothetical protein